MDQQQYLKTLLLQSGIDLPDDRIEKLIVFYRMLSETSKVMNLTTITEFSEVCRKHFLDSLSLIFLFEQRDTDLSLGIRKLLGKNEKDPLRLIDVGCGAGFPGLVLAIAFPDVEVVLLDSLQKRVGFLNSVIEKLALANCTAIHQRAEELAKDKAHRECYDIALSRAVANLSTLSEYCLPFVRKEGLFIAYKSVRIKEEAPMAERAIKLLGGAFDRQKEFYLPGFSENKDPSGKTEEDYRNLYLIRKIEKTASKYPRKAGLPSRDPL